MGQGCPWEGLNTVGGKRPFGISKRRWEDVRGSLWYRIDGCGLDLSGSGLGPVTASCVFCNELRTT